MNKFKFRRTHNLVQVLTSYGTVFQTSSMEEAKEWARQNSHTMLTGSIGQLSVYPRKYGRLMYV